MYFALYIKLSHSNEYVSTISKYFRTRLKTEGFTLGLPEIAKKFASADGTVRYLLRLADGETVEAVWMPEGDDGETGDGSEAGSGDNSRGWSRATICISSQVGCAVNCQFCLTALLGVKRNLTAGEIVGQVIAVLGEQNVSPP